MAKICEKGKELWNELISSNREGLWLKIRRMMVFFTMFHLPQLHSLCLVPAKLIAC